MNIPLFGSVPGIHHIQPFFFLDLCQKIPEKNPSNGPKKNTQNSLKKLPTKKGHLHKAPTSNPPTLPVFCSTQKCHLSAPKSAFVATAQAFKVFAFPKNNRKQRSRVTRGFFGVNPGGVLSVFIYVEMHSISHSLCKVAIIPKDIYMEKVYPQETGVSIFQKIHQPDENLVTLRTFP